MPDLMNPAGDSAPEGAPPLAESGALLEQHSEATSTPSRAKRGRPPGARDSSPRKRRAPIKIAPLTDALAKAPVPVELKPIADAKRDEAAAAAPATPAIPPWKDPIVLDGAAPVFGEPAMSLALGLRERMGKRPPSEERIEKAKPVLGRAVAAMVFKRYPGAAENQEEIGLAGALFAILFAPEDGAHSPPPSPARAYAPPPPSPAQQHQQAPAPAPAPRPGGDGLGLVSVNHASPDAV